MVFRFQTIDLQMELNKQRLAEQCLHTSTKYNDERQQRRQKKMVNRLIHLRNTTAFFVVARVFSSLYFGFYF